MLSWVNARMRVVVRVKARKRIGMYIVKIKVVVLSLKVLVAKRKRAVVQGRREDHPLKIVLTMAVMLEKPKLQQIMLIRIMIKDRERIVKRIIKIKIKEARKVIRLNHRLNVKNW